MIEELKQLEQKLTQWSDFLSANGHSHFAEILRASFDLLQDRFSGDLPARYKALLDFQDTFKGAMGSLNDLSIDDSAFRQSVEKERDRLIDQHYDRLYPKS